MTTYPYHGMHFGRPRLNLLLFAAALAVIIGMGAWLLVDHYTSSSQGNSPTVSSMMSDAQAAGSIQAIMWREMSARERPYAIRMYRSAPYDLQGMKLFYAFGAVSTHFQTTAVQDGTLGMGRASLIARFMASPEAHPFWLIPYGVTVDQAAVAITRGMYNGATNETWWIDRVPTLGQ